LTTNDLFGIDILPVQDSFPVDSRLLCGRKRV